MDAERQSVEAGYALKLVGALLSSQTMQQLGGKHANECVDHTLP
jgi:hypothetical protein